MFNHLKQFRRVVTRYDKTRKSFPAFLAVLCLAVARLLHPYGYWYSIYYMASVNTQFSIAVHVMAAIAHHEGVFASEILAGSVNANPVFVKRVLVKLSKAKLAKTTVGKSGGYGLARSAKSISLLDIYSAVNPPDAFAIHTYPKRKECVVSSNIKEVMSDVLVGTQEAVRRELRQTTLADVVSKIRARSR